MTYKKSSKEFFIKILKSPMNKWPKKRNFMSQFLCFFDTIILCQVHHTTDHLLTRLLFPYVECPYLWIWSMTFFGGKRTSSESKKVFCCCHYRYQFSNLSADADIGDCPPKYTGISLWGRKRVGYYILQK